MTGIQQPLSTDVELQKPDTLEDAMALARAYERRQHVNADTTSTGSRVPARSSQWPTSAPIRTPPPPSASGSTSALHAAPVKTAPAIDNRFKRLSPEEMAQRRLEGLCFNCPEKFSKEHVKHCTSKGIYFLELAEDEDASEGSGSEDDLQVSVAAITGIQTSATLRLGTTVSGVSAVALVDSGSTHSFIDESLAQRLGFTPEPRPGLSVGVANGDRINTAGICKAVRLIVDAEEFMVNLFVIPLGGFRIVLGCDWLRSLGPIL